MAGSCRVPAWDGVSGAPRVIFRKRSPLAVNISHTEPNLAQVRPVIVRHTRCDIGGRQGSPIGVVRFG